MNVWKEHINSRQATKQDLVDIARALGLPNSSFEKMAVSMLRTIIRNKLDLMAMGLAVPYCNVAPPPAGSSRDTDG